MPLHLPRNSTSFSSISAPNPASTILPHLTQVSCFPFDDHNYFPIQVIISFCQSAFMAQDLNSPLSQTIPPIHKPIQAKQFLVSNVALHGRRNDYIVVSFVPCGRCCQEISCALDIQISMEKYSGYRP